MSEVDELTLAAGRSIGRGRRMVNQPVARVLKINGYDPARTNVRLVRRFTDSSLCELEPPHAEP